MASPTIHGTTAPAAGLSSTSPSSTIVGDLVVVITIERTGAGVPTHTIQSGYKEIFSQPHNDGNTDGRLSVGCIVATAAGAQSYQAYTSSVGTETWTGLMVLDKDTFDPALIFRAAGSTQTTNAVPNPPVVGIAATAPLAPNDYLIAAISFWRLGSSLTLTPTAPTNYTLQTHVSGAATADVALSTRAMTALSGSEDPGAYGDNQTPTGTSSITIAFVAPFAFGKKRQVVFVNAPSSGSATAYPQQVQAGALLIADFGRVTNSTPTVTDSQGNTWALARSHYDSGNDYRLDTWYAIAGSTGANSVTITAADGGAPEVSRRVLLEYQGPFDASPLDVVNSANGTGTSPSSGDVTPSVNGTLIHGYLSASGTGTFTVGTGFTEDFKDDANDTQVESLVQATAAAQDADGTLSASGDWAAIVAAFKPVASGQTIAVTQVQENDTAQPVAWAPKSRLVAQVQESDTSQALTVRRSYAVAQVQENDSAQVMTAGKTLAIVQAQENDTAQAVTVNPLRRLVTQVVEEDTAQPVTVQTGAQVVPVAQVQENDSAQVVVWAPKSRLVAQVVENDTAQVITPVLGGGPAPSGGDWHTWLRRRRRS